ncbi:NAD(P)H-dependent oxidoreductase [Streptomyces sp. NPDC052496]|uniref:NADPH-dependent FMN reductase n=1 Tax=Streptomyces sp. NPDC052496 TaxID=3154951 RepID=UPI003438DB04
MIDLEADRLPLHLSGDRSAEVSAMAGRLGAADGFVIITSEYNRSFPTPLKAAIDRYQAEWQAKPVGFVTGPTANSCKRFAGKVISRPTGELGHGRQDVCGTGFRPSGGWSSDGPMPWPTLTCSKPC